MFAAQSLNSTILPQFPRLTANLGGVGFLCRGSAKRKRATSANTEAHQVFLGPSALGILHNSAMSFGAQFSGPAVVEMTGNTTPLKQLNEAITENGFTVEGFDGNRCWHSRQHGW